ncbi:PHP domain-containing protein [Selenomonas sp. TAMA-11512]|uniref:PHP domain-containing protein n=1 Tax=Selenomonas sp. TAMA-11512 TaxID=3095337 RepID=UPI0030CBACA0
MHTTFSDGTMTPEEIIALAREKKLRYIAITDHDTVEGITYLYEEGLYPTKGIGIIPGIEFSAENPNHEVHILGYNIDIYQRELNDRLNDVGEARWTRFAQIIEKLKTIGYPISETEVLQIAGDSRSISRSHIARVLVSKGFFPTVSEAYDTLLTRGKEAYVSHYRLSVEEVLRLIHNAGGISVLAHPKLIGDDSLVESLLRKGFDGIEAYYPKHSEEDTNRYLQLAEKHGLLVTGGSDFHGANNPRYPGDLGLFVIDDKIGEELYRPIKGHTYA